MVIPDEGKRAWLGRALSLDSYYPFSTYFIRLYSNDYLPTDDSIVDSFVESTFGGYVRVIAAMGEWSLPVTPAHVAESVLDFVPTFSCTSAPSETAYGWYMTNDDGDICLAAQRFDAPRVMVPGAVESLDPFKIKLKSFT